MDELVFQEAEEKKFRFCGTDVEQFEDMSTRITCVDAIETVGALKYDKNKRKADVNATEAEIAQMRIIFGSLGWIASQCHPELSYGVSKM